MIRRIAAISGTVYLATLVAAPLVDGRLDVLRSYPEDYSSGPADPIVRLGYLSVAVMAFAIAAGSAREPSLARRAAALMLASAAAASLVLAIVPQQVTGGPIAVGVVLGYVLAPLMLSVSGRHELPRWLVVFGIVESVAFLSLTVAPRDLTGITNRVWDVLLALWGIAYATARHRAGAPRLVARIPA